MDNSIFISDAFEIYRRDYIVYQGQSKKTEEMHLLSLKSLRGFLGDIPLKDLTFQNVRDWKEHIGKDKTQNTVRGYILKLRVVLEFMRLRGYECINHQVIAIPKKQSTPVDFINEEDVAKLIEAVFKVKAGYTTTNRYRNRAVISLLYASGLRVSELCRMNISDIQRDNTFTVVGKRGKVRLCFLDDRTKTYIQEYLKLRKDNNPALFLSDLTSQRVSASTVQKIFRVARVKAGFTRPIHPHTMRHSFATNLLRNNTNLLYVKEFLGHTSVQTTEMYTHVVNEDLRRIYLEKHTL